MSEIKLTFRWSVNDGQARMSEAESTRLVERGDMLAADFLQDVIAEATQLYNVVCRSALPNRASSGEQHG